MSSGSEDKCRICLTSLKGQAFYTAECSHSFHFHCISSNGNQFCPVCLAILIPPSQVVSPIIPQFLPQQNYNSSLFVTPSFSFYNNNNEPAYRRSKKRKNKPADVYNDDEALDLPSSSNNATDTTTDGSSSKRLLIETYTEVPAVPQLTAVSDFTVLVHLKASEANSGSTVSQNSRAPVDLVTVLDISWSMHGTKLALLKQAMGFVIENLGPADRLSVITFSDTASRLFPLKKMSDTGKQHALQAVNSLKAYCNTNIADGLRMSGKVMEDRREKNPVASIMLLSDGQDTFNMDSSKVPRIKFPVHTFGFGEDHDAKLMHSISESSRGTFSFIENENVIQDTFAQCIGGILSVVVKGLQVTIESANPDIQLRSLKAGSYKNQMMPDRKSGCVDVGDMYDDEERDFLVSVNIPKETVLNETSLVKVNCYYTDPLTKEAVKLVSENVTIKRPENIGEENVVSIKVDKHRNRLQSAEAMEQARKAAEEGDLRRAVSILENFRKVLSETISAKSGDPLCTALDVELKELQNKMTSRHTYEHSGRANILSALTSHKRQRATAYGGGFACGGTFGARRGGGGAYGACGGAYQTRRMTEMIKRSQKNSGVEK